MYVEFEPGTKFIYTCEDCGYRRPGVLDHPLYSTICPECRGHYHVTELPADNAEPTNTDT